MVSQLWQLALAEPPVAVAFLLMTVVLVMFVAVTWQVIVEARQARETAVAEWRRDQVTAERRARLLAFQRRDDERHVS